MSGDTDLDLRAPLPDPWQALRAHTPARIGLGRSGTSLPTREVLAAGVAHARARDAVHAAMDCAALRAALARLGLQAIEVDSAAPDRARYLRRPDLGRQLSAESRQTLGHHPRLRQDDALLLVIADGLSATAIARHAVAVCAQILAQRPADWSVGPVILARQARVALGDACGDLLGAPMVAVLIGERPGLSTCDSLGIYLTHTPGPGLTDADRNCISNIHAAGLSPAQAAAKLWWLIGAAQLLGATGVALKDESQGLLPG